MARSKSRSMIDATLILQIIVALFLITLGIVALTQYNSRLSEFGRAFNRIFGRPDNPVNLIVGIAELVAGILIALALVVPLEKKLIWLAGIVIAILWIINILWVFVFNNAFEPDFVSWLNALSLDCIVLVGLWIVARRYA